VVLECDDPQLALGSAPLGPVSPDIAELYDSYVCPGCRCLASYREIHNCPSVMAIDNASF
jgi:hypothetical protein